MQQIGYFGTRRTGQEVKRKWSDLKSRVKAKAASLAIETDKDDGNLTLKLTPNEERVLAIISRDLEDQSPRYESTAHGSKWPSVKVFSFHNESNSGDRAESDCDDVVEERIVTDAIMESEVLVEEIKLGGSDDKKRRISEAFTSTSAEKRGLGLKRLKIVSEEEQLQALCSSQIEVNAELRTIKDILKKCQQSIEKIALLKRAELRLKCAKYGVEFDDLFD